MKLKRNGCGLILIVLLLSFVFCPFVWASNSKSKSFAFFSKTQFPLKVYYIQGEKPGPTVMVQGGIQGDEPCGYLTAQLLSFARLKQGNLIIVPRANRPAIIEGKRRINVDLNRRFDQEYTQFYEDYLARVIKFLVQSSDALIHLHEGSGFYCPRYVDRLQNPERYGQSVIIDTAVYKDKINLAKTVRNVLPSLNKKIARSKYQFQLFNTKTYSAQTQYPEQKKSLTYFTLQHCGIPAIAIEVSKDIKNIAWKIEQQLRATACFLYHFGLRLDLPNLSEIDLSNYFQRISEDSKLTTQDPCKLIQQGILNTKSKPFSLQIQFKGSINSFDPAIGAFSDKWPELNLLRLPYLDLIQPMQKISLKSQGRIIDQIKVEDTLQNKILNFFNQPIFICLLNDKIHFIPAGDELVAHQGDRFVILGVWQGESREILNAKGYLSHSGYNNGQDMGHEIILSEDFFLSKYLLDTDKQSYWRFKVVRETKGKDAQEFSILVLPQKIQGLELTSKQGDKFQFPIGKDNRFNIPPGEYVLTHIFGPSNQDMYLPVVNGMPMKKQESFFLSENHKEQLNIYLDNTFELLASLYLVGNKVN